MTVSDGQGGSAGGSVIVVVNAPLPGALGLTALRLGLNFAAPNKDTCKAAGAFLLSASFQPLGAAVELDVGGAVQDFTLDARGKGISAQGKIRVKWKRRTGNWTFKTSWKGGNWANDWADDGLVNADTLGTAVQVPATLQVGSSIWAGVKTLTYKAKLGRSGKAR